MVTPFQKITLISSILIASAIGMPSFAKTEKQCGNGELLVSKKIGWCFKKYADIK